MREEALAVLSQEILNGVNTDILAKYADQLSGVIPASWAQETEQSSIAIANSLGGEITAAKASQSKQRIREAHTNLGIFLHNRGDLNGSLKQFMLARDHYNTSSEMAESSLKAIVVAFDLKNFFQVNSLLNKIDQRTCDGYLLSQCSAAHALLMLRRKDFKQAAFTFSQVSSDIGNSLNALLCAEDVAIYGTLCALAYLSREEAKGMLCDSNFRNFIDLVPTLSEMVSGFFHGRYGAVISWLQLNRSRMLLDFHMGDFVDEIFDIIQNRCVLQFVTPYLTVSLVSMADAFALSVPQMETTIASLISNGSLNARIDSAAKTVHVVSTERRAESFAKVADLSDTYLRDMQALLLRMSCLEQDVVVTNPHEFDPYSQGFADELHGLSDF